MNREALASLIAGSRFRFSNEDDLQAGIELLFESSSVDFCREVRLNKRDRIDFMVGRTGIEVKVDSPIAKVTRQIHRYAQCDDIDDLILVSNRSRHALIPHEFNGKSISYVFVGWSALG